MSIINGIKAIFDAPRLHARIAELEEEVSSLEEIVVYHRGKARTSPSFVGVAQGFDADPAVKAAKEKVVHELSELLSEEALMVLRNVMLTSEPHDGRPGGLAAMDVANDVYVMEFHIPSITRRLRVARSLRYLQSSGLR